MQVLEVKRADEGGASLATAVRELASEARKVIAGSGTAFEAQQLVRRIDRLEDECEILPSAPIRSWLTSLRQQLQAL